MAVSDFLTDTNILLRSAIPTHPMYQESRDAVDKLRRQGERPCLMAQNLVEFRSAATRPVAVNGLGISQSLVDAEIARLKLLYQVFADVPAILPEWELLVRLYGAAGKQNHDARLVAAMMAHGVPKILTFNKIDFIRYPDIVVVTPAEVLAAP